MRAGALCVPRPIHSGTQRWLPVIDFVDDRARHEYRYMRTRTTGCRPRAARDRFVACMPLPLFEGEAADV